MNKSNYWQSSQRSAQGGGGGCHALGGGRGGGAVHKQMRSEESGEVGGDKGVSVSDASSPLSQVLNLHALLAQKYKYWRKEEERRRRRWQEWVLSRMQQAMGT